MHERMADVILEAVSNALEGKGETAFWQCNPHPGPSLHTVHMIAISGAVSELQCLWLAGDFLDHSDRSQPQVDPLSPLSIMVEETTHGVLLLHSLRAKLALCNPASVRSSTMLYTAPARCGRHFLPLAFCYRRSSWAH